MVKCNWAHFDLSYRAEIWGRSARIHGNVAPSFKLTCKVVGRVKNPLTSVKLSIST